MKNLLLYIFLFNFAPITAKIIYVSPAGKEDADGSSWALAFQNIRLALEYATYGDSIWLKEGEYGKYLDSSYHMKSGVKLYGGFKGYETSLDERGEVFNHSRIIGHNQAFICLNTDSTTMIDGIYFGMNYASIVIGENDCNIYEGDYRCAGGAIFVGSYEADQPACLKINNCIFFNNAANYNGGAVCLFTYEGRGGLWVSNSIFKMNQSLDLLIGVNQPGFGGACTIFHGEKDQYGYKFENCLFEENEANTYGAVQIARTIPSNTVEFINCLFKKNKSKVHGGAVLANNASFINCHFIENSAGTTFFSPGLGGALIGTDFLINNCSFRSNRATKGGGIYGSRFTILNSQFNNTYSKKEGGAIYQFTGYAGESISEQKYVHCTFFQNSSDSIAGAILARRNTRDSFINCLFSENLAKKLSNNIHFLHSYRTLVFLDFNYFDTEDTTVVIQHPIMNSDSLIIGPNNLFSIIDPRLGRNSEGLLRPGDCSPLIHSADPNVTEQHNLNYDLAGRPRPVAGGAVGALDPIPWNPEWYSRDESCPEYMDGAVWLESEDPLLPIILSSGELSESDTLFLSKGLHDILAMDDAGCKDSMIVEIDGSAEWIINDTVVHPLQDQSNGYIHISEIQGDNPPYLIQWSTGEETCCINDLAEGIYTASITDNIGCEKIITYELSFTIATSSEELSSCWIYPNPASDVIYLDCDKSDLKEIELISVNGRTYSQIGIFREEILRLDLQNIPNGIYFIRITDNQGKAMLQEKLIVQKTK